MDNTVEECDGGKIFLNELYDKFKNWNINNGIKNLISNNNFISYKKKYFNFI